MKPIPGITKSGAENKKTQEEGRIETKVQKAYRDPAGNQLQGMKAHGDTGRAPRILKPGAGLDQWAGPGAKSLCTCFSGFKSQDRTFLSFNSLLTKCRKWFL